MDLGTITNSSFISITNKKMKNIKKRKKDGKLLNLIRSSTKIKIKKQPSKRKKSQRAKKLSTKCMNSLVEEIHNKVLPPNESQSNNNILNNKTFNETIDLCDIPYVSENLHPVTINSGKSDFVDLSKEFSSVKEVIDLTESTDLMKANESFDQVENQEPTVIVLSEDEDNRSDDICVIGTFSQTPKSCSSPNREKSIKLVPLSCKLNKWSNLCTVGNKNKQRCYESRTRTNNFFSNNVTLNPFAKVGENISSNVPVTLPKSGLRPIIIDGSNVAYINNKAWHNFSCKRLNICINYFKERGHSVTAFVPQFRVNQGKSEDPDLLKQLEKNGDVVFTPSKTIDGVHIVPYDDRFIIQTAVLKGGVIVSRDNYKDLLGENPAWTETIKYRTLAFTWIEDVLMFPKDPLGLYGPTLERFLKF